MSSVATADFRSWHAGARTVFEAALDCIIGMDEQGRVVEWNPAAQRCFGFAREEVIGRPLAELIIPVRLREAHRQGLARHLATGAITVLGRRVELSALRRDGNEFPVELAITRVPGTGAPLFIAYLRDITERVRADQLRSLRLAATQQLAQASGPEETMGAFLRAVCEQLRWDFGAFWGFDASGTTLVCRQTWGGGTPRLGEFAEASRERVLTRGEGLPGQVWESGRPLWLLDVRRTANFPRAEVAERAQLRSAFACPVGSHGVLEFFTGHLHDPDAELLETMGTVAAQLAQALDRNEAEQRLRESESRFRALMDQAPFSVQIFSPEGRTLRVNPAWCELWGVGLEQVADYNVLEDPQLEAKGVLPDLRRAFAGEPAQIPAIAYDPNLTIPDRTRHADPVRFVSAVAYPLKDDAGQVREVVLVHEDITARRRAESALRASEEKLRLLADTIPQLAWMADPDGSIVWYNRRWYDYTGTTPEQMQGWGWQSVHDPSVLPEVLARWRASIDTGEPFDMVFPLRGADGAFRPFLTRVNPLKDADGRILHWFGTNTDVSDIKRMEDALRESDRRKDEFLATLAHELRNPLAPIVNTLQILKTPALEPDKVRRCHDMMERQVRHLVHLVDDLLDMSRIVRGKIALRREPLPLERSIAAAVEMVQPLMEARGHQLQVTVPPEPLRVDADAVRLVQVLGNLLTNAARYTPPKGSIQLTAHAQDGEAVVSVADNGIGIAPEMLARVFDPFVQGSDGAVRSQGGLGIGLTLVKSLVELHGGRVCAASAGPGRGSRFEFTIPLAASPAQREELPHVPAHSAPRRVLVVDDNRDAADSLAALLRMLGHDVEVAYGGLQAIDLARSAPPEVVFLDIGMPGLDGHETARRLRALPGMETARIHALTGWGQDQDRRRSAEAGFDRHLVKPPDPATLQQLLARAAQ